MVNIDMQAIVFQVRTWLLGNVVPDLGLQAFA